MPTGYTAPIEEDPTFTFEQYVWRCARAFGALIMMRDEPMDARVPERFEPSGYYARELGKERARLLELEGMSAEAVVAARNAAHQQARERVENSNRESSEKLERYRAIRSQVEAWEPPSPDHVGLKRFMLEQIDTCTEHLRPLPMPEKLEPDQWHADECRKTSAPHRVSGGRARPRDAAHGVPQPVGYTATSERAGAETMTDRPILFSAPMVRAILAGTKTQTRRVVAEPRAAKLYGRRAVPERHFADDGFGDGMYLHWAYTGGDLGDDILSTRVYCPFGKPGDRLWVKEAIRHVGDGFSVFIADGEPTKADAWLWKVKALPGMYCPRGLSRITLEVTGVRVERLQAITEEDARAEGVSPIGEDIGCPCEGEDEEPGPHIPACSWSHEGIDPYAEPHRAAFAVLWDALNGKRAPWASSPWVWVVEFRRVEAS
jgi:hypothetical protein